MIVTHNLTREEAAERSRLLEVDDYDVVLDLTADERVFASVTTVRFACHEPGSGTFIEIAAEEVVSATLNGRELDVSDYRSADGLRLDDLAAHNTLVVAAKCPFARDGEGLHRLTDPADGESYVYTHFEANNAQLVYACFDQPDLKARFRLRVIVPAGWHAVSNMPANAARKSGRTKTVQFAELPPTSTYLTALCAGPWHEVVDSHDGITLSLLCRASMAEHLDAETLFDLTKRGLDHFHAHFGYRYPLPKYDQIAVPQYNSGATENFGLVVYAEPMFVHSHRPSDAETHTRSYVMYHEMAHMWFGNLVTPRWWDETWLKESFATWAGMWTLSQLGGGDAWAAFAAADKNAAYLADTLSTSHPVHTPVDDVKLGRTNFDAITYAKGASILKQLAAFVGIEEFCAGLRSYFADHAWGVADFSDLRRAIEATTGTSLGDWTRQWLTTTGYNRLRARFDVASDGTFTDFAITQHPLTGDGSPREQRVGIGLYDLDIGRLNLRHYLECTLDGQSTPVSRLRGVRRPDVVLLNDSDLSYTHIGLDDASRDVVWHALETLPDLTSRVVAWTTYYSEAMSGDLPAVHDFVSLVERALPLETDGSAVAGVGALVDWVIRYRMPPGELRDGYARLADTAWRGVDLAVPGSGAQRSWMELYCRYARRDTDVTHLLRWIGEWELPAGVALDEQLRWKLRIGLAAAGAITTAELDAAARRDPTIEGAELALTAAAALREDAAKARAFELLEDPALSNSRQRAILRGFFEPDQFTLTIDYVRPFLVLVSRLWSEGLQERAVAAAAAARRLPAHPRTLAALDEWLERDEPPAPRRYVVEARDLLARGARDAAG